VSQDGESLRPAVIWADSRADRQAKDLTRRLLGEPTVRAIAGAVPSGKDVVPKLLWLIQEEPWIIEQAASCLDVKGYLIARCTGEMTIDWCSASEVGLMSSRRKHWSGFLAGIAQVPQSILPRIVSPTSIVGRLLPEPARELGLEAGLPVVGGAGDVAATAIGVGAGGNGAVSIYLGTSSWVAETLDRRTTWNRQGVGIVQSVEDGRYLRVGESEAAGACVDWLVESFIDGHKEADRYESVNRAAALAPPGSEWLLFLPWLFGERAPIGDVSARAGFLNIGPDHRFEHFARALFEGVALNMRMVLGKEIGSSEPLRLAGGGASSDVWMQILADVIQRRVARVARPEDAGAVGAGLIATVAIGAIRTLDDTGSLVEFDRVFVPQSSLGSTYDELFAAFRKSYAALRPIFRRLNDPVGRT